MASSGGLCFLALGLESKVDHHNGVLLHDSDQQNDADQRHHCQIVARDQQSQDCAHARRGQRGENRNGVNVAFVQHSQHDVHRDDGGQNQKRLTRKRILESRRCPLE